jgi:folate-dependent phosphoribosylglycinamide formyltransferase PurN
MRRIALLTSSPRLLQSFLRNDALCGELGIEIPLVVWIRPSMRLADRCRDLHRTVRRRARINRTSRGLQLLHYLAYRWVTRDPSSAMESGATTLGEGRRLLELRSANDPAMVAALHTERCALGIVFGVDVLSRRTLESLDVPLFNIHLSDPAVVRGLPPVFWEILAGCDAIHMTLHALIAQLDAGPIVTQREVPIVWQRTLGGTISRTLERCRQEVAWLLADGLRTILDGSAQPRSVVPGTLRTTPTIQQIVRAARICRMRAPQTESPPDDRAACARKPPNDTSDGLA